ncbi:MAG: hypothetical protein QOG14_5344, partial [Mycobacterium sp.]|nr:hypothetical protein [Mycobacterium sp.]
MIARLYVWYADHPRLGRPALLVVAVQALALTAVCAAPDASAATNLMVLNWTGLRDTYGVPIGDYYLALASVPDQIAAAASGLSWNPGTWMPWMSNVLAGLLANVAAANILTGEAGLFVGIVAMALWLLKVTVSTYWLTVIGEIARAIAGAAIQVTTAAGLLLVAVPIGVFAGAVTVKRGEAGRGWTMIGIALTMPAASVAIFDDPAGMMYGPDGLLAFARRVGFSVASAATRNGALAGSPGAGQVDTLTASLITHTVREPLQLWNFGHVVDRVGGCGAAWSAAVSRGAPEGPIQAMTGCGDRPAVLFAQHLDGTNMWVGLVFVAAAAMLAIFMVVSGWMVLKVSVKAIWTTAILLPALWVGAIPGAPQRRAVDVVWQFFRHGVEVLVYVVYVSVIGLAVQRIVSAPLPPELGGTNPFAHVLMMGGVAIVALVLLRHIRAEMSGRPAGPGLVRQASSVAVGMGMTAAFGAAGSAAVAGARGLRRRSGSRGELTPWEKLEAQSNTAAAVHGAPQPGFDPVQGGGQAASAQSRGGGAGAGGGVAAAGERSASADVAGLGEQAAVAAMSDGQGDRVESPRRRGRPQTRDSAAQPDTTS